MESHSSQLSYNVYYFVLIFLPFHLFSTQYCNAIFYNMSTKSRARPEAILAIQSTPLGGVNEYFIFRGKTMSSSAGILEQQTKQSL